MKLNKITITKSIIYIILSFFVAIITIIISLLTPQENATSLILNILFSTNACFIITTAYGITGRHKNDYGLIKFTQLIGTFICGAFLVVIILHDTREYFVHWIAFVISIICSLYLTYVYTMEIMRSDKIILEYIEQQNIAEYEKLISSKHKKSYQRNGTNYEV